MDALVLAGGTLNVSADDEERVAKALVDVNGRPMLSYVLEALKGSKRIGKIAAVLPSEIADAPWLDGVDSIIHADGNLPENFYAGLSGVDSNKKVLVVSVDIPLLTSEGIDDFLDRCEEKEASVYYSMVSKKAIEEKYPGVERTYMALLEGKFTGGNIFVVDPQMAMRNKALLKQVSEVRKSPFKVVRMLGLEFIIRFIFRMLSVKDMERKISSLIGARGVAVDTPYVEISVDVDKPSDIEFVRKELVKEKGTA